MESHRKRARAQEDSPLVGLISFFYESNDIDSDEDLRGDCSTPLTTASLSSCRRGKDLKKEKESLYSDADSEASIKRSFEAQRGECTSGANNVNGLCMGGAGAVQKNRADILSMGALGVVQPTRPWWPSGGLPVSIATTNSLSEDGVACEIADQIGYRADAPQLFYSPSPRHFQEKHAAIEESMEVATSNDAPIDSRATEGSYVGLVQNKYDQWQPHGCLPRKVYDRNEHRRRARELLRQAPGPPLEYIIPTAAPDPPQGLTHRDRRRSRKWKQQLESEEGSMKKRLELTDEEILDLRFSRPPRLPRLSRWNPRCSDPVERFQPCCNPGWLVKIQRKFPWFENTLMAGGGPWLSLRSWDAPYQSCGREVQVRWKNRGDRCLLICRLVGVGCLIFALLLIDVVFEQNLYDPQYVTGVWDWFHEVSVGINYFFQTHPLSLSLLLFFASLAMDIMFLIAWFQWLIIGDSTRLPIAYALLYGIRAFMRVICIFPMPQGYIWRAPQFGNISWPSLVVPYQPSDDFFFSGHVACCVLVLHEHFYYRCWWGFIYTFLVTVLQVFIMIVTRGHYMIDMIIGAIVASWIYFICKRLSRPIDQWLGLPPRPIALPKGAKDEKNTPASSSGRSDCGSNSSKVENLMIASLDSKEGERATQRLMQLPPPQKYNNFESVQLMTEDESECSSNDGDAIEMAYFQLVPPRH